MLASASRVWHGSKVVRGVRRTLAASTVTTWVRDGFERVKRLPESLWPAVRNAEVTSKAAAVGRAADESGLARASREGTEWARQSFLYRWLTADPEPNVVVIDLRETVSVGPLIELVDGVLRWIVPYWAQSIPGRILGGLVDWGERVANTRFGQILIAMLEPPEPPERPGETEESFDSERDEQGEDEQ